MRQTEKCSAYDYALVEAARVTLRKPNALICVCVHCRAQAKVPAEMKHSSRCCFNQGAAKAPVTKGQQ